MIRLLLTRRWIGYLALTVVFALVSSFFGLWQWDRRSQAVAAIDVLESHWDKEPAELMSVVSLGQFSPAREQWTPVVVSGEYVPGDQILVRTRPRGGQVGFEVLVPLQTDSGLTVVVNRGWIPTGEASDFPDVVPGAPSGAVSLVARIKPGEPTLRGRGAPEGQLPSIDLEAMKSVVGYDLETRYFLLLDSETPGSSVAPLPGLRPVLDEGPHLSYTLQWFVFAALALVAFFGLLRAEARREAGIELPEKTKKSDADEEDALLDRARI
jgi:cytochrome oxidase assembly protein ShyY1